MTTKRILGTCALGAVAGYTAMFVLNYWIFGESLKESLISPIFVAVYCFAAFSIIKLRERKRALKAASDKL